MYCRVAFHLLSSYSFRLIAKREGKLSHFLHIMLWKFLYVLLFLWMAKLKGKSSWEFRIEWDFAGELLKFRDFFFKNLNWNEKLLKFAKKNRQKTLKLDNKNAQVISLCKHDSFNLISKVKTVSKAYKYLFRATIFISFLAK